MLRRTVLRNVHLFSALLPSNSVTAPNFIKEDQLPVAKKAVEEAKEFLGETTKIQEALDILAHTPDVKAQRRVISLLEECNTAYRSELYKKTCTNPFQRLQLHEAIMVTGFYSRIVNTNVLKSESTRFVLNHYNFDVRRDTAITSLVHDSLLEERKTTEESEKILTDLLLLERRLFGNHRFVPTGGRHWFVLGLLCSEITTEEEIKRVLELPPIKNHGNFAMEVIDKEKELWKTIVVKPLPEPEKSFLAYAGLEAKVSEKELCMERRIEKPPEPLEYWERIRQMLLRYWVIWFSIWITFFMVDEEILTLVALIFLKYRQTQILEEEAEKTGGKVYVASASGRWQKD